MSSTGQGGKIKVLLRFGDMSELDCGLCVFCLGLTTLVVTQTNWLIVDVLGCDAFCAEVADSGVVNSHALFSFTLVPYFHFYFHFDQVYILHYYYLLHHYY